MKMSFSALYSKFKAGRRLTHLGTEGGVRPRSPPQGYADFRAR